MKECGLASSQKKLFLSHVEDHANISDQAILLLAPKDRPKTVAQIARMASVLRSWLDLHIGTYDVMLRR